MPKGPLSKSALVQTLADKHSDKLTRKDVKGLLESIVEVGHTELKKNGIFVLPGPGAHGSSSRSPPPRSARASTRSPASRPCSRPSPPAR